MQKTLTRLLPSLLPALGACWQLPVSVTVIGHLLPISVSTVPAASSSGAEVVQQAHEEQTLVHSSCPKTAWLLSSLLSSSWLSSGVSQTSGPFMSTRYLTSLQLPLAVLLFLAKRHNWEVRKSGVKATREFTSRSTVRSKRRSRQYRGAVRIQSPSRTRQVTQRRVFQGRWSVSDRDWRAADPEAVEAILPDGGSSIRWPIPSQLWRIVEMDCNSWRTVWNVPATEQFITKSEYSASVLMARLVEWSQKLYLEPMTARRGFRHVWIW